jgi:hypothetical protein
VHPERGGFHAKTGDDPQLAIVLDHPGVLPAVILELTQRRSTLRSRSTLKKVGNPFDPVGFPGRVRRPGPQRRAREDHGLDEGRDLSFKSRVFSA